MDCLRCVKYTLQACLILILKIKVHHILIFNDRVSLQKQIPENTLL